MKKVLGLVPALIATACFSLGATAAALSKVGEVKSADATKHELVLSTGDTFVLPKTFKTESLKPGEKVKVSYETKDGKNMATHVAPEK